MPLESDNIDVRTVVKYLANLVEIPSPTGFTDKVQEFLIEHAKSRNIKYSATKKGAVRYIFDGQNDAGKVVAFAAHVDTLGAIVRNVVGEKIQIAPVGGLPAHYAIGDYCTIHTFDGMKFVGTILPENPSVHVSKKWDEERIKFEHLWIRIDDKLPVDQSWEKLVPVGSYVTLDPRFRYESGFVNSRFLDDKASAAILLALADELADPNSELLNSVQEVYIFFNITEETGQGIAGLPENLDELVITDMGVVGDGVKGTEHAVSICIKDSSGPYHYGLTKQLIELCITKNIAYCTDIFPFYASDGSAALRAGKDVKTALIGPGIAASHGYERTNISSLEATLNLLFEYLKSR